MTDLCFRSVTPAEAEAAAELEKESLHTAWTAEQIRNLPPQAIYIGAFCQDLLCGIVSAYIVADEVQIMNLAVSPQFRRRGVAFGLMNQILLCAEGRDCNSITLEVAENNSSAISLYEKCGFTRLGKRKGFYRDVDGLVMGKFFNNDI